MTHIHTRTNTCSWPPYFSKIAFFLADSSAAFFSLNCRCISSACDGLLIKSMLSPRCCISQHST